MGYTNERNQSSDFVSSEVLRTWYTNDSKIRVFARATTLTIYVYVFCYSTTVCFFRFLQFRFCSHEINKCHRGKIFSCNLCVTFISGYQQMKLRETKRTYTALYSIVDPECLKTLFLEGKFQQVRAQNRTLSLTI